MQRRSLPFLLLVTLLMAVALSAGCAKKKISPPETIQRPAPPAVTQPGQPEPLQPPSRWQKPRTYTINGKTYTTMSSAAGFVEDGVASWYGKDFHGRKTANGEVYDMYGMTAAHKLLPFNTPVRVTNLENGRSTILRVNDRGPFIKDRIIDLTYTAAQEIGMAETGTARVRVEALDNFNDTPNTFAEANITDEPAARSSSFSLTTQAVAGQPRPAARPESFLPEGRYFVQIGAFGKKENAENLMRSMQQNNKPCRMVFDENSGMWRVQVGPFARVDVAENTRNELVSVNDKSFIFAD